MLRGNLSGNTFQVKETIKDKGFRWNSALKNWSRESPTLTVIQSDLEAVRAELEAAGIRATVVKVDRNPANERLVWWEDFGRVSLKTLSTSNEDEEDVPAVVRTVHIPADRPVNVVASSASSGAANVEELVIEIPQWLARQLGCSRVLRGHWEGVTENREYTRRDGRTGRAYMRNFIGHNEIGGTSRCYRCGRELTDPVSRAIGYGAECCRNIGLSRRVDMNDVNNIRVMDTEIRAINLNLWIPTSVVRPRSIQ